MHPAGDEPEIGMGCGEFRCPFRFAMLWVALQFVFGSMSGAQHIQNRIAITQFLGPNMDRCTNLSIVQNAGHTRGALNLQNPIASARFRDQKQTMLQFVSWDTFLTPK